MHKWGVLNGSANFYKASIIFVGPLILMAYNPPDFGKLKPDLNQIKKVPNSILNIGKVLMAQKLRKPQILRWI